MPFIALDELAARLNADNAEAYREEFGGKAINLAFLHQSGCHVPPAFVIPTGDFLAHAMRALQACDDVSNPRQVLAHMTFEPAFVAELKEWFDRMMPCRLAIRSSSTDEDTSAHSFAGLQESVLDVATFPACLEAVRKVWQSFYARERLMYPSQAPLDGPIPSMAIIVQVFVASTAAGVIFTHHPLEGKRAVLINVSRGSGAHVVDATAKASESLCIVRNPKDRTLLLKTKTLSHRQIHELVETALAVERLFGTPQDIEFAFDNDNLFLLQTRDIVAKCHGPGPNQLFSNVNVGEALSGVATPMTWSVGMSFARHGFETMFQAMGLGIPPHYSFVTTFFGHIYLNISELVSVAHQIPFMRRDILAKISGIPQLTDLNFDVQPLSRAKFIREFPISVLRLAKTQSRILSLSRHAEAFVRTRDAFMKRSIEHASQAALIQAFDELNAMFHACGSDMLCAGSNFLASYILVSCTLSHMGEDAAELEPYLFSGLLDVQSAEPGLELLDIANAAKPHAPLVQAILAFDSSHPATDFLESLRALAGGQSFLERFNGFLERYGARANQEAELANPRWREDPRFLIQVIQGHLRTEQHSPQRRAGQAQHKRRNKTHQTHGYILPGLRMLFKRLLQWAQRNARLREQWRSYVVDCLAAFRHFFLACAKRMHADGLLAQPGDVFFLSLEEFRQWLNDPNALQDARFRVAFRRARHQAFLEAPRLPDTFALHPNLVTSPANNTPVTELRGIPASPGNVRARVRVIRDLEQDVPHLVHGEIIVATSTDVGWTPLFLLASAILTERGGPLSHAFVVAREYGIPAVVSIPNLLNTLKTGDMVTVIGQKGIVQIEH
ncbi:MAG: PEP-utilizing enzyme [Proteobacteria bacterium]|nr:PEP-utilizing enzyme [Pseudomonadota bacterium]